MKDACRSFSSGNLPQKIRHAIGALPIPPDLRDVATTFVKLQEERHRADYDLAAPFSRMEVLALLGELDGTINAWKRIRTDDMARFFLVALPLWKQF